MRPVHAVLGRYPALPDDYFVEVLLDDLVESGAWLDLELKTDNWKDPIVAIDQANVRKFVAMDPVVDLESLRGMNVKLVYDD